MTGTVPPVAVATDHEVDDAVRVLVLRLAEGGVVVLECEPEPARVGMAEEPGGPAIPGIEHGRFHRVEYAAVAEGFRRSVGGFTLIGLFGD